MNWKKPFFALGSPTHYRVFLRKSFESETWMCFETENDTCSLTINNLPINTEFVVSVCACNSTEQGPLCDESDVIRTANLAVKMKDTSTRRREREPHSIPEYDVPLRVNHNEQLKVRMVMIGNGYNFIRFKKSCSLILNR